jgi:hypothetical protein
MRVVAASALALVVALQLAASALVPRDWNGPSLFWLWAVAIAVLGYFLCRRIPAATYLWVPLSSLLAAYLLNGGWVAVQDGQPIELGALRTLDAHYLLYAASIIVSYLAMPLSAVLGYVASYKAQAARQRMDAQRGREPPSK